MSNTVENLQKAIKGETEAKHKYNLFSQKAMTENLEDIAHLFKAVSFGEQIHIENHVKALEVLKDKEIGTIDQFNINIDNTIQIEGTEINLKRSIQGEMDEFKNMYKDFVKIANKEDFDVAELSFTLARKAEKQHASAFKQYLKFLKKEKKIPFKRIYICQICGNIEFDDPPENCPVCDHSKKFFKEIKF
jgi:rubrerythrin